MRSTFGNIIWKNGTSLMHVLNVLGSAVGPLGGSSAEFFHTKWVQDFGLSDELLQKIPLVSGFKWHYKVPGCCETLRFGFLMSENPDRFLKVVWACGASVTNCYTPGDFTEALLYYKLMKSLLEPLGADYIYGCADKQYQVENPWDEREILRASFLFRRHGWIKQVWHLEHEQVLLEDQPSEEWPPRFIYRHMDTGEWFESNEECPARVLAEPLPNPA